MLRLVQPALVAVVHTRVWGAIVGRRPYCADVQLLQQCAMAVGSIGVCVVVLCYWSHGTISGCHSLVLCLLMSQRDT